MLRNVRIITPLVRSLVLGVASVSAVAAAPIVLVGCEDDTQPDYYAKRLNDPKYQTRAAERLVQFFDDAMSRSDGKRDADTVKALLDKIVPPLVEVAQNSTTLDDATRTTIVKLLCDTRDLRAKPVWVKALNGYKPGITEPDARAALRAIAQTGVKDQDAMDAMINFFTKFEAGSPKGSQIWSDVRPAMVDVSSPSWNAKLIELLARPMEMPTEKDNGNEDKIRAFRNEQLWQVTAAEILGNTKATDAIKPLFKTLIDPNKADVAGSATISLTKIGKDSMNVLVDALLGKDKEVHEYALAKLKKEDAAKTSAIQNAAIVIGFLGRSEGIQALTTALSNIDKNDNLSRAIIARSLAQCPPTAESYKTFLEVYENMPPSVTLPPANVPAVSELADKLVLFYDSGVVDVLINRGEKFKGESDDRDVIRDAAMANMIKVMKKEQLETVEKIIASWAPKAEQAKLEKEALGKAKAVVTACGDNVACYLAKLEEASVQDEKQQFAGIKAAVMLGILGNEQTAAEIAKRFPNIKNAAIKFAAGQALDHLLPKGSTAIADEMDKMIQTNKEKGDRNVMAGDAGLKQISTRIRGRQ